MAGITNAELSNQLGDVRQEIGKVLEGQRHAEEGRGTLHNKVDKVVDAVQLLAVQLAEVSKDASMAVMSAAQTRDRIDAFDREVTPVVSDLNDKVIALEEANSAAAPLLDTVKQARNGVNILLWIAGISAGAATTIFTVFNAAARVAVRGWLGV